jgi:2-dehydro-3-deoxy-D-arabinonate dehydratase
MKLYNVSQGIILSEGNATYLLEEDLDDLLAREDLAPYLKQRVERAERLPTVPDLRSPLPPIGTQEVWAAGVTYFRSREARMEEARSAGGSDFYDRVYHANRPELFFKTTAHRVVGHGGTLRLRRDSSWIVPEPELTLVLSAAGTVVGYTIGNDLSCRDIEGENPLYLPQAKTFDECAALGPCILVADGELPAETRIALEVERQGATALSASTELSQLKRSFEELAGWLFAESSFRKGCFLMTGTGIVPPDDFTLLSEDVVRITVEPIGILENTMSTAR